MVLRSSLVLISLLLVSVAGFTKVIKNDIEELNVISAEKVLDEILNSGISLEELDQLDSNYATGNLKVNEEEAAHSGVLLENTLVDIDYQYSKRRKSTRHRPKPRYPRHRPNHNNRRGTYYPPRRAPRLIYCYAASNYGGFYGYAYNPRRAQDNAYNACGGSYSYCQTFGCGPSGERRMNNWLYNNRGW